MMCFSRNLYAGSAADHIHSAKLRTPDSKYFQVGYYVPIRCKKPSFITLVAALFNQLRPTGFGLQLFGLSALEHAELVQKPDGSHALFRRSTCWQQPTTDKTTFRHCSRFFSLSRQSELDAEHAEVLSFLPKTSSYLRSSVRSNLLYLSLSG